jgi:hypothetical protein
MACMCPVAYANLGTTALQALLMQWAPHVTLPRVAPLRAQFQIITYALLATTALKAVQHLLHVALEHTIPTPTVTQAQHVRLVLLEVIVLTLG